MFKEDTCDRTTAIYPLINVKYHAAVHGSQDKNMRLKNPILKVSKPLILNQKREKKNWLSVQIKCRWKSTVWTSPALQIHVGNKEWCQCGKSNAETLKIDWLLQQRFESRRKGIRKGFVETILFEHWFQKSDIQVASYDLESFTQTLSLSFTNFCLKNVSFHHSILSHLSLLLTFMFVQAPQKNSCRVCYLTCMQLWLSKLWT